MNCSEPPTRPGAGTWEWNKEYSFETEIIYTCGPYGNFKNQDGMKYEELITECAWNKTWVPTGLDECAGNLACRFLLCNHHSPATSCQIVPFPPKSIGMIYSPDEKNNMSLTSGNTQLVDKMLLSKQANLKLSRQSPHT